MIRGAEAEADSRAHRATIEPVAAGVRRPLWSVMIPAYNCAEYLTKTIESVLEQDPGSEAMQIEVVDDCSTKGDPEALVRSVGGGRVGFYRQPTNVGHVRNFESCLRRSRGTLIHLLHGDDYVLHGFYRRMSSAFEQHPETGLATCRHAYATADGHWRAISRLRLEHSGIWTDAFKQMAIEGNVQTPSVVVRRECYEALGGFDDRLVCTEDYEMWARIASKFPVWYETECLAVYRFHSGSNSVRDAATAENIRDSLRSLEMVSAYAGNQLPAGWQRQVRRELARSAITVAGKFFDAGKRRPAIASLREAIHCDTSAGTLARAARCLVRGALHSAARGDVNRGAGASDVEQLIDPRL